MSRSSRLIFFTVAAIVGIVVATAGPALAQEFSLARPSVARSLVGTGGDTAFLVAGMTSAAEQGQPPRRNPRHQGFGLGVKFGPIFSSFSQANHSFKSSNGFEGGIFFGGNRGGVAGIMGEILYAKKGREETGKAKQDLTYLEIPILLRINVGTNSLNGINFYGIGGPVFDLLLKGDVSGIDVKSQYESLDIGFIAGAGVEITRFLIEGRYNWGVKNALKSGGGAVTDIKSRSFAVLFGFRIN